VGFYSPRAQQQNAMAIRYLLLRPG